METTITDNMLAVLLPPIARTANKYSRGSLLVLAGSQRFPGAAVLAARAAARTGAGYVTLAVPEPAAAIAQGHLLSVPVVAAPATQGAFAADAWGAVREAVTHVDAIVIGPGITVTPSTSAFVEEVLREAKVPVLIDADALTILASNWAESNIATQLSEQPRRTDDDSPPEPQHILTPHAGELKRLLDATGLADAQALSDAINAVIVAKNPETSVISLAQSRNISSGTPALAKAGTGDVLSGIIGSLVVQGSSLFLAALAGVELHARAGCVAERLYGRRAVCAEDVIEAIPTVLRNLEGGNNLVEPVAGTPRKLVKRGKIYKQVTPKTSVTPEPPVTPELSVTPVTPETPDR